MDKTENIFIFCFRFLSHFCLPHIFMSGDGAPLHLSNKTSNVKVSPWFVEKVQPLRNKNNAAKWEKILWKDYNWKSFACVLFTSSSTYCLISRAHYAKPLFKTKLVIIKANIINIASRLKQWCVLVCRLAGFSAIWLSTTSNKAMFNWVPFPKMTVCFQISVLKLHLF